MVRKSEIIAMINLANKKNISNNNFIKIADVEGKIVKVASKENMKSLIITDKRVYLSNISSATLWKRAKNKSFD